jgi:ADP-heptose:LPS heptosyltransferase
MARHRLMNVNYLDFQHAIAEAPAPHRPRFHATLAEEKQARDWRRSMRAEPVILWALAGSSVHKVWPGAFEAITRLLTRTDCRIVTVGGRKEQEIEYGCAQELAKHVLGLEAEETERFDIVRLLEALRVYWGTNRLICTSGSWPIRRVMAALPVVDCVVGPETGVLNAASMLDVPKVVFLSHSSHENLTRDWVNTTVLEPQGVDCYPCHRLHHGFEFCPQDPQTPGIALCQASITTDAVLHAIADAIRERRAA